MDICKRPVNLVIRVYRPLCHAIFVSKLAWLESAVRRWGMMMAESMFFVRMGWVMCKLNRCKRPVNSAISVYRPLVCFNNACNQEHAFSIVP